MHRLIYSPHCVARQFGRRQDLIEIDCIFSVALIPPRLIVMIDSSWEDREVHAIPSSTPPDIVIASDEYLDCLHKYIQTTKRKTTETYIKHLKKLKK